jgi:hypothetical protein
MKYEGLAGEHIAESARNAIELARKHNRKVTLVFNDQRLKVTKRNSVDHVLRTWQHAIEAASIRYRKSPAAIARRIRDTAEVAELQKKIDLLIANPPKDRYEAIAWLSEYIPASDRVGVQRFPAKAVEIMQELGFLENEHVGDKELLAKTASITKRIQYIAGQFISMMNEWGSVHPMLGEWAGKCVRDLVSATSASTTEEST